MNLDQAFRIDAYSQIPRGGSDLEAFVGICYSKINGPRINGKTTRIRLNEANEKQLYSVAKSLYARAQRVIDDMIFETRIEIGDERLRELQDIYGDVEEVKDYLGVDSL
jgi:hypothetical protein